MSSVWDKLRVDERFCDFFKWNNIDFFAIVERKLKNVVEKQTINCLNTYEEVSEFLINREIKAILFSTISTCTAHSAAKAAHNLNIPVVAIKGDKAGIARNIESHWRLIGYGEIIE